MLGTSLQFGGLRGEDQFYIPVKSRKNQIQNQRNKTQRDNKSEDSISKNQLLDSENKNFNEDSHSLKNKSSSGSNIDRFLESTTPLVPAHYFSKVDFVCLLFNYEFSLSFEFLICALFDFEGTIQ
jgi:hypothetical protein